MRTSKSVIYTFLIICTAFLFTACEKSELQEELELQQVKIETLDENWEKREHVIDYPKSEILSEELPQLKNLKSGTCIVASIESELRGPVAFAYREGKGGNVVIGDFENPAVEGEIICNKVLDNILIITLKVTKGTEADQIHYCTLAIRDNERSSFINKDMMAESKVVNKTQGSRKGESSRYDIPVLPRNEKDCMDPVFITPIVKNFISWESANGEVDILH